MEIDIDEAKIKIWIVENPTGMERGIATVKFGQMTISGFRILENDEAHKSAAPFWVAPPAYRTRKGKFQQIFWITDKELWQKLQTKLLEAYNKLLEEKPDLKANLGEIPVIEEKDAGSYKTHY